MIEGDLLGFASIALALAKISSHRLCAYLGSHVMPHSSRSFLATLALTATFGVGVTSVPALAEKTGSFNLNGTTGLIDMPSGEAQKDATFSFSMARIGPLTRATFSFQFSERVSASFRFNTWRDWDKLFPADNDKESDRTIDLRYQVLKETDFLPAVTIGLNDIAGKGWMSSEYVAATKNFGKKLKVTAGLGWGRLGTQGSIGQPFGSRPPLTSDDYGKLQFDQWFRGDAAVFGGVEYKLNDRWTVKAEYSSDAYELEDDERDLIEHKSPLNFGLEYQKGPNVRFGVYSLYGSEVGLVFHLILDPKNRASGGVMDAAPVPVKARPSRSADPDAYDGGWVTQPDAGDLLRKNLEKRLKVDGITIEDMAFTAQKVEVRIRGGRTDAGAQSIGRTARALSHVMPASVEVFEIVPVVKGVGVSKVIIRRSDLEDLEYAADNISALQDRVEVSDAGPSPDYALGDDGLYPKFRWSLKPTVRITEELEGDAGVRLSASYDLQPGLFISGSVYGRLFSNTDAPDGPSSSILPHVRSDSGLYTENTEIGLERLTMSWYARPGANLYSRVTVGYLERMHAGVSGELLWKPVDSKLGVGVELNYSKQRNTDGGFGFDEYDYDIVTGHLSAYYDFGNGYLGQVDVGRYLAGDVGATISFDRVFVNGWRVGAFATITDASDAELGTSGYDKGLRVTIPLNWALGNQSRSNLGLTLRPGGSDAGARLNVEDRLYDGIRDYHKSSLDSEWGRVWR